MSARTSRYVIEGKFERIPGQKRRYRELSSGKIVSRYYMEKNAAKVALTKAERRQIALRRKPAHDRRVTTFKNNKNREVWLRGGTPESYWGASDVEIDQEFVNMELLLHARDADIRGIGHDYFDELEDEYIHTEWGDSPGHNG